MHPRDLYTTLETLFPGLPRDYLRGYARRLSKALRRKAVAL